MHEMTVQVSRCQSAVSWQRPKFWAVGKLGEFMSYNFPGSP